MNLQRLINYLQDYCLYIPNYSVNGCFVTFEARLSVYDALRAAGYKITSVGNNTITIKL